MHKNKIIRLCIILLIIAVNTGCDQISKSVIRNNVLPNADVSLLNGHFLITRVENTGAFLSLGDNSEGPARLLILSIIPIAMLIMSVAYLVTNRHIHKVTLTGICFIVGGGVGNIFDRVVHGSVTDFLYLTYHPLHTGVFNMADVSITIGAFFILVGINIKNPPRFIQWLKQGRNTATL